MHGEKKEIKFGKRASKYDIVAGKFLEKFYDYMKQFVELKENDRVLDVACGTGAILECLKDKGIVGYGIDISEKMLEVARKKFPQMNFCNRSCDSLPYKEKQFDVVTVCMAYHHFENKEGFAKECIRVLKDNGDLYVAELRMPELMKNFFNGVFKHHNVVGRFHSTSELKSEFEKMGFVYNDSLTKGRVEIVRFKKNNH